MGKITIKFLVELVDIGLGRIEYSSQGSVHLMNLVLKLLQFPGSFSSQRLRLGSCALPWISPELVVPREGALDDLSLVVSHERDLNVVGD